MSELKPCPFCGDMPLLIEREDAAQMKCSGRNCEIRPQTTIFMKPEPAIKAWNRRVEIAKDW